MSNYANLKNIEALTKEALRIMDFYESTGNTEAEDYVFACASFDTLRLEKAKTDAALREAYSILPWMHAGHPEMDNLKSIIAQLKGEWHDDKS